jgi:hypothetical protein
VKNLKINLSGLFFFKGMKQMGLYLKDVPGFLKKEAEKQNIANRVQI